MLLIHFYSIQIIVQWIFVLTYFQIYLYQSQIYNLTPILNNDFFPADKVNFYCDDSVTNCDMLYAIGNLNISAIKNNRNHKFVGKYEIFSVYVKQFFPKVFYKLMRKLTKELK